jgi:reversibly glycosylated polypeptide/UDP-arabinopyranose mutase
MLPRFAVVIPNHLPNLDFLRSWETEFLRNDVQIIVMHDRDTMPTVPWNDGRITIYTHNDVKEELGDGAWIIPRQTSACRSFGYWKAWQTGAEYVLTLDNDCYSEQPNERYWLDGHAHNLERSATLGWINTIGNDVMARGFPYEIRGMSPTVLSHGLWSRVPDLDAATWLHNRHLRLPPTKNVVTLPQGSFFPMCGMNLAWRRELTPAMYFGLFGPEYGFDQFDDIWAGVLVKRVCDHLGFAVASGAPSVEHRKQSNVYANMVKQAPGMAMNERFWRIVRDIQLTEETIENTYAQLIRQLPDVIDDEPPGWTAKFKKAALEWLQLFR